MIKEVIKFEFDGFDAELGAWAKHHKFVGSLLKRVYDDGEVVESEYAGTREIVEKNKELLRSKRVDLVDRETMERRSAMDYYLPILNTEYIEPNIEDYFVGAMNTKQKTSVRLTFLIDADKFILDYSYDSEGSFATSFHDMFVGSDAVEDVIGVVLEQGEPIEKTGIVVGEKNDYRIIVVSREGFIQDVEVTKEELIGSLIGIEMYAFDQEVD